MKKEGHIRALFKTKSGRPIFPLRALFGLLIALLLVLCLAALLEYELRLMSNMQMLSSNDWYYENIVINRQNREKVYARHTPDRPVMRGKGFSPAEISPPRKRIVVIGDSFIYGHGLININIAWWRQLNWELEKRGYYNVDVIGVGLDGASTQDQYGWLSHQDDDGRLLEILQPDVVIFGYVVNDPDMRDEDDKHLLKPFSEAAVFTSQTLKRILPNLIYAVSTRLQNKRLHKGIYNDETGYPFELWSLKALEGKNFTKYKELLFDLKALLDQYGKPYFFVTTPNFLDREHFEARHRPVQEAMNEIGIPFYDLLPAFLEQVKPGKAIYANPADNHPGPVTTRFYAREVVDILEQRYPEILGEKTPPPAEMAPKINDWLPAKADVTQVEKDHWDVKIPFSSKKLTLPVGEPHISLNFERPVLIDKINLTSSLASSCSLWVSVLDAVDDSELPDPYQVGAGKGESFEFKIPDNIAKMRITSLRISTEPLSGGKSDKGFMQLDLHIDFITPGVQQ